MLKKMMTNLREKTPLVHNITNYVTVNDCANMVLATGGAPLMADDAKEVEEIVAISSALYLNIGTLNTRTVESMLLAGKKANALGKPIVLDPVGVGASTLRNETAGRLLEHFKIAVIKGNSSEIRALYNNAKTTSGVDVQEEDMITDDTLNSSITFAKKAALKFGSIVVITGSLDIITDGKKVALCRNGHTLMARITGTGCMLGSMIATYCGGQPDEVFESTVHAIVHMSFAGEKAAAKVLEREEGTGHFRMYLIDEVSLMTEDQLEEGVRVEYFEE
ncbi:hydroxyethylthiazole kinase [Vallitalea okinawensis]|uniref:hydroxyethylthiazole kinase n=1 Tax=Vallitalea okinawensis TaxID=2078660 RepID=UPI000CFD0268|nr:hydroxyethylthiazole kinase [Vallitalea okinawensis]